MKQSHYRILFGLLWFTLMQPLQAANLGLTPTFPDFTVGSNSYVYDYQCIGCTTSQGKLTIDGTVNSYTEDPTGGIINASVRDEVAAFGEGTGLKAFSLTAILNTDGTVASGSFFIDGVVIDPLDFPQALYNGFTHPSGNLLNGDLALFGFSGDAGPSTGGILEFTFGNAGGYIADPLFPLSELGGITFNSGGMILTVTSTDLAPGTFATNVLTSDWAGSGFGDVFVPLPAAVWLFGSGLVTLLGLSRGRKKK